MHNSFILQQYVCYTRSSTCFEQHAAHPQEDKLYHHSLWYRQSSQTAIQYAGGERTKEQSALHRHTVWLFTAGNL